MVIPIALFFLLTIGNYSFFRYSIGGISGAPLVLRIISQLRLILPIWIIFFALRFNFRFTGKIIGDHIDVVLLGVSWLISSIASLDVASYLLYGTWTLTSLVAVLLFVSYTGLITQNLSFYLLRILQVIWLGNGIIILMDFVSILLRRPGGTAYNIIFSSNTFWAYPTMIMGVLSLILFKFFAKSQRQKILYIIVFLIALYLVYFSARRSTLFVLVFSAGLCLVPLRLPQLLLISFMLSFLVLAGAAIDTRQVLDSLPESSMKYRLERMFGLVKNTKESSYDDRQKIWDVYFQSFYDNPLLGAGLASNERLAEKFPRGLKGYSAHNTFVGMIAETGILGSVLFLIVIARSLLLLLRVNNRKWIQIYVILFVPTLLINWVEYNLIPGQIFFLYSVVIWLMPRGIVYLSQNRAPYALPAP